MKAIAVIALLVCAAVVADAASVVKYHRTGVPKNSKWQLGDRAPRSVMATFHLALHQRNIETLKHWLDLDSDPTSPVFAQHKTQDQILSLIEPPKHVQQKVIAWINKVAAKYPKNHVQIENLRDAIKVRATVEFIEELFETELHVFVHSLLGHRVIKHMGSLSMPEEIFPLVQLVTGITELPPPQLSEIFREQQLSKKKPRQVADNQCNTAYTMKNLYNWPQDLYVTQSQANLTIFASLGGQVSTDGFGEPDLLYFQNANGLPANPITCVIGDAASSYTSNYTDDEAQLDVQMSTSMAPNVHVCFYITEAWMYEFGLFLFTTPGTPVVASMSYAWFENQQCFGNITGDNCPAYNIPNYQDYINRTSVEFAKLGLRGHSMVAASGDGGTAGNHGSDDNCETLGPLFPAASPYVTSVGATSVEPSSSQSDISQAAPAICTNSAYSCTCSTSTNEQIATGENTAGFDTGGGFSSVELQPQWQVQAVQQYLKSGVQLPPSNLWSPNNRAYPDIGAIGENVCVMNVGGACSGAAGTSASTPLIAAMISLLNNDRLAAGKKTLGFFTPLIYNMYNSNRDLYFRSNFTQATNPGGCTGNGFYSNPNGGWNPLVGVGSPHFAAIRKYIATLP